MATLANARNEFEPDIDPFPTDQSEGSDYAVTGSAPATEAIAAPETTTSQTPAVIDPNTTNTDPVDSDPLGSTTDNDPLDLGSDRSIDAVSVQELYPEMPELGSIDVPEVPDATGSQVTEADIGAAEVGTPGVAETDTGGIVEGAVGEITDLAGEAQQSELTAEQQVDAELARILGQDSPLLQQARAEAARQANARGLMNSSMAAGMTYAELVKQALPMAQQNADQAFQRELENARLRQEAGQFTAEEVSRLRSLEAELGQELSIFNAEQLNQAEQLAAELRTAIEQGNAEAYNEAALQLAELQRDAESQQAELDYAASEREFLERQAYNEQIIDAITELNKTYMSGEQLIDVENIRGQYNQLISTNETAAAVYDAYLSSIGSVFANEKLSTAQTLEAVRNMVDMMEASFRMIGEINGMDFIISLPGGGGYRPGPFPGDPYYEPGGGGGPGKPYNPNNPDRIEP